MTEFIYGSYNLERGGIDNGDDRRLRRQLAMLAEVGADGWAMQECKHWADDDSALLHLAEEQAARLAGHSRVHRFRIAYRERYGRYPALPGRTFQRRDIS